MAEARPRQEGHPWNPEAVVYALITSAGACASASGLVSAPQLGSLPGRPDVPTVLAAAVLGRQAVTMGTGCCCRAG